MQKLTTEQRFWDQVDKQGPFFGDFPCFLWRGSLFPNGYGQFKGIGAHRFAFEALVHPIAKGLHIHHRCGRKNCVNPYHLEPIQPRQHVLISNGLAGTNAKKTHCARGHEFTPENTVIYPQTPYKRYCRECQRAKATIQNAKKSARKKVALNGRSPYKNAQKTHCLRGHEFTQENTRLSNGRRVCRQCRRAQSAAAKKKAHVAPAGVGGVTFTAEAPSGSGGGP